MHHKTSSTITTRGRRTQSHRTPFTSGPLYTQSLLLSVARPCLTWGRSTSSHSSTLSSLARQLRGKQLHSIWARNLWLILVRLTLLPLLLVKKLWWMRLPTRRRRYLFLLEGRSYLIIKSLVLQANSQNFLEVSTLMKVSFDSSQTSGTAMNTKKPRAKEEKSSYPLLTSL